MLRKAVSAAFALAATICLSAATGGVASATVEINLISNYCGASQQTPPVDPSNQFFHAIHTDGTDSCFANAGTTTDDSNWYTSKVTSGNNAGYVIVENGKGSFRQTFAKWAVLDYGAYPVRLVLIHIN